MEPTKQILFKGAFYIFKKGKKMGWGWHIIWGNFLNNHQKTHILQKCWKEKQMRRDFLIFCSLPTWVPVIKHWHITWQIISFVWIEGTLDLLEFLLRDLNGPIFHSSSLLWPDQISKLHRRGLHTAFGFAGPPVWEWIQIHSLPVWSNQDATFHLLS